MSQIPNLCPSFYFMAKIGKHYIHFGEKNLSHIKQNLRIKLKFCDTVPSIFMPRTTTENFSYPSLILNELSTLKQMKGKNRIFCTLYYIYLELLYQQ